MVDGATNAAGARSKDGSVHVTDEKFNTASHLSAALLGLLGTVVLVVQASVAGKPWHIVSFSIYGLSLVLLFLASTLHHGVKGGQRLKAVLRSIDYFAIYLLIAGTFTPMCLVAARGPLGWSVFGVTWAAAAAGITLKAVYPSLPKWVSLTMYVTMGWFGATMVHAVFDTIGWYGFATLLAGGVLYTVGALVFIVERPNPLPGRFGFHEIWHVFVILGALAHFVMMYRFVLPLP